MGAKAWLIGMAVVAFLTLVFLIFYTPICTTAMTDLGEMFGVNLSPESMWFCASEYRWWALIILGVVVARLYSDLKGV